MIETTANEAIFGEDARKTPNNNFYKEYYWMENAYGRKVPVSLKLVPEKLKKGYTHTDKKIYVDDASDRVRPDAVVSPMEKVAQLIEVLADVKTSKKGKKTIETEEETV